MSVAPKTFHDSATGSWHRALWSVVQSTGENEDDTIYVAALPVEGDANYQTYGPFETHSMCQQACDELNTYIYIAMGTDA